MISESRHCMYCHACVSSGTQGERLLWPSFTITGSYPSEEGHGSLAVLPEEYMCDRWGHSMLLISMDCMIFKITLARLYTDYFH